MRWRLYRSQICIPRQRRRDRLSCGRREENDRRRRRRRFSPSSNGPLVRRGESLRRRPDGREGASSLIQGKDGGSRRSPRHSHNGCMWRGREGGRNRLGKTAAVVARSIMQSPMMMRRAARGPSSSSSSVVTGAGNTDVACDATTYYCACFSPLSSTYASLLGGKRKADYGSYM